MDSIVERFRKFNQGLYDKPTYGAVYYRAKISGTAKEKGRKAIQSKAQSAIQYEVRKGAIVKPKTCQTCGDERKLVAHHWRGYDHPLDVWWICHPCHKKFPKHDGSVTLERPRERVKQTQ